MAKEGSKISGYGSLGQRLVATRTRLGKSREEMAAAAGIPLKSYIKYERDEATPGGDALAGIGLTGIDILWLLTGRGGDELGLARAHSVNLAQQLHEKQQSTESFVLLPLYDVRVSAGHGALAEDRPSSELRAFSRVWLSRQVGLPPARLKLVTVAGDSMVPDLNDGDEVMIDTGDVEVLREGVYVFALDGHIYVKRLALRGTSLMIISSNPAGGEPQRLDMLREVESFRLIGRVVGQPLFRKF